MRRPAASLALAIPLAMSAAGQDEVHSRQERIQPFNACKPMSLVLERLSNEAAAISLTEEDLRNAAVEPRASTRTIRGKRPSCSCA